MNILIPTFILQMKSEIPLKTFDMFIRDGIVYIRSDDNSCFWNKCNVNPLELNTIAKLDVLTQDSGRRCLVVFSGENRHEKTEEYLLEFEKVRRN